MRVILGYEGDGRHRTAIWSENVPAEPALRSRPGGEPVVGRSNRELARESVRRHKARKAAEAPA